MLYQFRWLTLPLGGAICEIKINSRKQRHLATKSFTKTFRKLKNKLNRHQNQVIPIPGSKDTEKREDLKYRFAISALRCLTLDLSVIIEFCLRLNNFIFSPEKLLFTWSSHQEALSSLTRYPLLLYSFGLIGNLVRDERTPVAGSLRY